MAKKSNKNPDDAPEALSEIGQEILKQESNPAVVLVSPPIFPRYLERASEANTKNWSKNWEPDDPSPDFAELKYSLVFSTGDRVEVQGEGIVGRRPHNDKQYLHVVKIPDTERYLSRNHFEFGITRSNELWVCDLGAPNGTYLITSGTQYLLQPESRTKLNNGDVIRFGEFSARVVVAQ